MLKGEIEKLFNIIKPKKLIEIGTGETTVILQEVLKNISDVDRIFYTVEIDPEKYNRNVKHFKRKDYKNLYPLCGLSIPRELLKEKGIFGEFEGLDDVIGMVMKNLKGKVDVVLLDGDIRTSELDFNYIISLLKSDCYMILRTEIYDIFEVEKLSSVFMVKDWTFCKYSY